MTREEVIVFLEAIKCGLHQTEKDSPYRDVLIPKMKEALCVAIKALEQEPCEDWCDVPSYEMTLEQARHAVKDLRKMLAPYLIQQPCKDAISRQAAINAIFALCDTGETLKENPWRDNPHIDALVEVVEDLPPITQQETYVNIPFLLHRESGCPLDECVKAYEKANEYLRSKSKLKG